MYVYCCSESLSVELYRDVGSVFMALSFGAWIFIICVCILPSQISSESEEFIVEQYKRLRQRDSSGGVSKSAWRITVRQLESMIRLSEAMARMHCCDEVCLNKYKKNI